jgi:beta-glucosidase
MSLDDKIALCSGADFWHTKAFKRYGIPSITMADGPHGLRKQEAAADQLGINKSVPATSFPTASLTACSWDRDLLREMGAAIAEEALQEQVSIVLGPGVNIKRNPLCGRNFEYFSEDPFLSGEMATSWIMGLQSKGVGASLKHFAGNNQEDERMSSDSIMDERTLREIYLPAFEKAVKQAKPWTVMCAYNKLNGVYCSDNHYLLRDLLRDEWGYEGVIVTDWGAMSDRIKAFEAGLDMEMPGSKGYFDEAVLTAIQNGGLSEGRLNESVDRLLDLIFTGTKNRTTDYRYDADQHHLLAKKIAANSAVLLKNEENILPLAKDKKIALMGALAKHPRYQGAGSSHISPTKLPNALEGFDVVGLDYVYYDGYALKGPADEALLAEAVAGAKECDIAVIFAGLPEEYESEGFDRTSLSMPDSHNLLISRVADVNPNTVVVLVGGAPVEMPWLPRVKAVLNMYLAGQAGGLAAAELLAGLINPSGKLAESYPLCYEDVPSAGYYEGSGKQAQYRETVYVGCRYYDKAHKDVLFPFGHGLSYTSFDYRDLVVSHTTLEAPYQLHVSVTIHNSGTTDGAEVVQVYVRNEQHAFFRAEKELKEFSKMFLRAGESKSVNFTLDARSFAVYDVGESEWVIPGGEYQILVGASSRDVRLQASVQVHGTQAIQHASGVPEWYSNPIGKVTQDDFEALLGRKIEPVKPRQKGEYTVECTFQDMKDNFIIHQVVKGIEKSIAKSFGGADYSNPTFKMIMTSVMTTPLKNLNQMSPDGMPRNMTAGLVHLANGKILQGIVTLAKRTKA